MRMKSRLAKIDWGSYRRIVVEMQPHVRPYRRQIALSAVAGLCVSLVNLAQPWPLKVVFDTVIKQNAAKPTWIEQQLTQMDPMLVVALASVSVLLLTIVGGLFTYASDILAQIAGHGIAASIRGRLFAHTQRLPQSFHDFRSAGDLISRLTGDIQLVNELLVDNFLDVISQIFLIVGMLVIMFWIDPVLALAALAILPFFTLAAFRFSTRIKTAARQQREKYGRMVDTIQESLAGIAHVKGFAQERVRDKLIGKSIDKDVQANVRTARLEASYQRIVEILNALGLCLVLWLGATRVHHGLMSAGDLLVFITYQRRIYKPLQRVARSSTKASKAIVRGEKILEILDMPAEPMEVEGGISAASIRGDIEFRNVSFAYHGRDRVIENVSFRCPAEKTTLLLGETGAGKSTMVKLMMRLYEPNAGSILLDGRDLREYQLTSLRKRITPLAQETFLFRTSIADNIGFGRRSATREEIEAAARFVGADAFIRRLPAGYDTEVGESGLTLSGGQRQWISFARAALRQSPIMVFDEPATGLDVHAEAETRVVLGKLAEGRTMVIITHRLHFLELADWLVFVRNGEIVESGSPADLIAQRGAVYDYVLRTRDHADAMRWLQRWQQEGGV